MTCDKCGQSPSAQLEVETLRIQLSNERARTDALVEALPKCTMPGCNRVATRAYERGGERFCDECGGLPHTREAPDYPRAAPLRAILEARK
jgi:hypothetical protein